MVPQGEVAVAPFDIGTGTLEHLGQLCGLVLELALLSLTQLGQYATGLTPRRAQTCGQLAKRLASTHRAPLGHALEIACGNELRVQSAGHGRAQVELPHLLVHIARHKLDGGLHFGHDPLGFVDALQAGLTETFMLRHAANHGHLLADICRKEPTVAPHASLYIDQVVGLADPTDALDDLLSLGTEARELLARRVHIQFELLQACGGLWGATWAAFVRRVTRVLKLPLPLLKPLVRLAGRLGSRPLLGGHGTADGFDQLMLHME
jgi:hypothetical protein